MSILNALDESRGINIDAAWLAEMNRDAATIRRHDTDDTNDTDDLDASDIDLDNAADRAARIDLYSEMVEAGQPLFPPVEGEDDEPTFEELEKEFPNIEE